jgi:hypothetical protein
MSHIDSARVSAASHAAHKSAPRKVVNTAPIAETPVTRKLTGKLAIDKAEQAALSQLPAERRPQYLALAIELPAEGRENLKSLLLAGKLPGSRDLNLRGDVLENLAGLLTANFAKGIDRKALVADAVAHLADVTTISQGSALTCAAAITETLLARRNPAEYLRILAGLASPEGRVQLAGGQTLTRLAGWEAAEIPGEASRLLQTSFMALAAGSYDARTDRRGDRQQGLYAAEAAKLQAAVTGEATFAAASSDDATIDRIAAQANGGKPVTVLLRGEAGSHYVAVTAMRGNQVTYVDPRDGKPRTVALEGFRAAVEAATFTGSETDKIRAIRPTDTKGSLGGGCVKDAVKSVGNAVSGAAKAVGSAVTSTVTAVGTAAKAVGGAVVTAAKAVGSAVATAATWVADTTKKVVNSAIDFGKRFVKDPLGAMKDLADKAWEGLKAVGKAAADFWNKYGDWVILGLTVVCAVVPGTQGLAVALASYQAVKGGMQVYEGIKEGDWRKAVMGGLSVVTAFAGGVGALGAKAVGQTMFTAANIAGKVANVAQRGVILADAIKSGNPVGIIGAAAGTAAGGLDIVGGKAAEVGAKLAGYGSKAMNLADALQRGEWERVAGSALQIGGSAVADVSTNAKVQDFGRKTDKVGNYVNVGGTVTRAAARGDVLTATYVAASVAGSVAHDVGASNTTVANIEKGAKYIRTGTAFVDAAQRGDAAAIAWLSSDMAAQAARDLGAEKAGDAIAKAGNYARNGIELANGIKNKDANAIAWAAGGLVRDGAYDLGGDKVGAVADKIATYGENGTRLATAAMSGDKDAIYFAATVFGATARDDIAALAAPKPTAGGAGEDDPAAVRYRPANSTVTTLDADAYSDPELKAQLLRDMTPARRQTFKSLENIVRGNPRALNALENLLTLGKLDDRALVGGGDLLSHLDTLATQRLGSGIDRAALLGQVLVELNDPLTINQQTKNTCGATVVQMELALRNPAEYARIIAGLSSSGGRATLVSGQTISRVADWRAADGGRSLSSKLMQPALMNAAAAGHYNNTQDSVVQRDGAAPGAGLYSYEENRLLNAALGGQATSYSLPSQGGRDSTDSMLRHAADALAQNKAVVALIRSNGATGAHYVLVRGNRDGSVSYVDPTGATCTIGVNQFKDKLLSVNIGQTVNLAQLHEANQARARR